MSKISQIIDKSDKTTTVDFYSEATKQNLPTATNNPQAGFGNFLSGIISAVMVIAALMVLLYLIWGAIDWITAGGDSGKIQKARDKMTQAIIGLIVLASTLAIFMLVQRFLGISVIRIGNASTGGGNGGSGGGTCVVGTVANDGGAGGYCTDGGAAQVKCNGADGHLAYAHYDPCSCLTGRPVSGYDFGSC